MEQERNISAMAGLDGSPVGVYVDGQFFKMGQLSQADYYDCAAWKAAQAIETVIAAAPQNFRPDVTEIKAAAIARIMDAPADPLKMLSDTRCIERLAYLAAKRGGEYPVNGNWDVFMLKLDKGRGYQELQQAVWKCSGFAVEKAATEAANATPNP